jgi:glycosyltransferase involved in cell wall biosynthesis
MALARPVVTTTMGIDGIPVVDGEHACIADTAEAFAEACVTLLEHPDRAQAMGIAAQRLARERYSWQTFVDGVIPWYERTAAAVRTHQT